MLEVGPGEVEEVGGKADASAGKAELKVTIEPTDILKARNRLSLRNDLSQTRRIWFFDTPWLEVHDAGTILRAREIDGHDDDSTVKLRPFTLAELAPRFRALDDLKCEVDRLPDTEMSSCSLEIDQGEGEIEAVSHGDLAIDKLFSQEQEAMFATHEPAIAWEWLVALGPIRARVWTIRTDELPAKATAELWYMPDGSQVLELSMKVEVEDGDDGMADLIAFVEARGLALAEDQKSKTRRALETLAPAAPWPYGH